MNIIEDLTKRNILKQITNTDLQDHLQKESRTLYCGFDPTADSLHVGSLFPLLTLKRFQNAGHTPIAVVGGATGIVGDPSGKTSERPLLDLEQLQLNLKGIESVIKKFLSFEGKNTAKIVNNADWFQPFSYLGFLRDVGKHFTVNHMLGKESVRTRLQDRDHGISYTEFSYMLLQAYDYYHLHKNANCTLQIGGSDQWGNITAGCELIRRMNALEEKTSAPAYGLTHPLVMKADGSKFGKTESGTIWLDSKKTSPYQFYQFWIQTSDDDIIHFLDYFSFQSIEQINDLKQKVKTEPHLRAAQKSLAEEMTVMVHGEEELKNVIAASGALFGSSLQDLDSHTLLDVFSETPSTHKEKKSPVLLIDLLVETGLCPSKGQARKDIKAGGIYLNNERTQDPEKQIKENDLIDQVFLILRKGKKNYHVVQFSGQGSL
ncbi:MAG: tyrosine--tRNA ligase [Bdellovibrionaceae bacterium]|nr:tyrosine--tRNA ligase [Pseudobdellovibrionaceae bacterium]|tara:strand:+ start:1344 stop:2639 length:1296 start_codon:yes stop_codon:yes gene_type:complete